MARTRQNRLPTGSVLVLNWLPVAFLSMTSSGVNFAEFAT